MRTQDEILARIVRVMKDDPLGFELGDLVCRLPFDAARPWLKPEASPDGWKQEPVDRDTILGEMRGYIDFAWEKALNHRGISASRSVSHYQAWIWLLGDDDFKAIDWERYKNYGCPILRQVCERYGFPMPDSDDAVNMMNGRECTDHCGGCGR